MNDILVISMGLVMSLLCEICIKEVEISILNMFLFINIIGLYYIIQRIQVEVRISFN